MEKPKVGKSSNGRGYKQILDAQGFKIKGGK